VVGSARPRETAGQSLMVLNLKRDDQHPNGYLTIYNREMLDIEGYLKRESAVELKKRGGPSTTSTSRPARSRRNCR